MDMQALIKSGSRLLVLIILILALLFVITFTGLMKCNQFPVIGGAWCNVYWYAKTYAFGQPRVLIVYGDYGLGNPIEGEGSLRELLANPELLGVHADTLHIDRVTLGNLRGYDLVIVDRAKKINTKELRDFIDYATGPTGGTLVWTGDAGTELGQSYVGGKLVTDEYLYQQEREGITQEDAERIEKGAEEAGISEAEKKRREEEAREEKEKMGWSIIGPWARRDGEYMINFDQLLGVQYLRKNYCEAVACGEGAHRAGNIETEPSGSHPLIRGISRTLPLYVFPGEDFALVETLGGGITTEVLSLNFGGKPIRESRELGIPDINRSVPLIVTAGLGERVVYYAMPPELYANPKLAEQGKAPYFLPIENMYYGILKG